jgi:hypothetical protein
MKNSTRLLATASNLMLASIVAVMAGCKYDVEDPLWDKPYAVPATPTISQIAPSSAPAGVNTIVITGQNLSGVPTMNGVYFGLKPAEIVSATATSITVRRPNLVADSCTVKVVSDSALLVAKIHFGKIDLVMDRFGSFADAVPLAVVAGDSAGNLLVISNISPPSIWRVLPDGSKAIIATTTSGITFRAPTDAIVKKGVMYLLANNREIQKVDLSTWAASAWTRMPSGKVMKCGDFDTSGYFYTGGAAGGDLCIVPPNPPATLTTAQIRLSGFYLNDDVQAVRYLKGYLYVASQASGAAGKIWRHAVSAGGTLGAQELVVNLGAYANFVDRTIRAISFSAAGDLYITTNATDPLLVYKVSAGTLDYLYKGIVPPYGKHAYWGSGTSLFMISGDATNSDASLQWNIARVAMGTAGASQ